MSWRVGDLAIANNTNQLEKALARADADGVHIEYLEAPADLLVVSAWSFHGSFDTDGNLYFAQFAADVSGGGRLAKWTVGAQLDTDWLTTPAGDLDTGLWPISTAPAFPYAPHTVIATAAGLYVGLRALGAYNHIAQLVGYDGTLLDTFDPLEPMTSAGGCWLAIDEATSTMYYVVSGHGDKLWAYDLATHTSLGSILSIAPGGFIADLHRNTDGNLITRQLGTAAATYGEFAIFDTTGAQLESLNMDALIPGWNMSDPGSWGLDSQNPTAIWATVTEGGAAWFYRIDVAAETILQPRQPVPAGDAPLGIADASYTGPLAVDVIPWLWKEGALAAAAGQRVFGFVTQFH